MNVGTSLRLDFRNDALNAGEIGKWKLQHLSVAQSFESADPRYHLVVVVAASYTACHL